MTSSAIAEPRTAAPTRTRPLAVCHVSMCLRTGGLERLLVEMARHTDTDRVSHRFAALAELGPPADELRSLGFPVDTMGFDQSGGPLGKLTLIRRLRAHFRTHRPDVVHAHNTYAHFYAALAARLSGLRRPVVVCTQHGRGCGPNDTAVRQFAMANRFTDRVLGVSEDAVALCRDQDPAHADRIVTLWNGVDVDRFAYSGPADGLRLIAVSRLSPEKDVATLLRAVAIARRDLPELTLAVVGDGVCRDDLETLAEELAITDCVTFLGERSDVPALLAESSLFVSSSLTEGISLTFLEAMGVGLPVLATRVGGNPEVIIPAGHESEAQTGELVPSDDPEAFAQALTRMAQSRDQWATWGRSGRRRVETRFSLARMIDDYAALYEELVAGDA